MSDCPPGRLSVDDARARVLDGLVALGSEALPLEQAAGRVLAEPVHADRDQPPFNRSAMDGFAVRAADTAAASAESPAVLKIVGEVAAGAHTDRVLGPGEAIRIMTGAPVPAGANAVQMVENTEPDSRADGEWVRILASVRDGQNIAPRGQDIRAGAVALEPGMQLTSARYGAAWSVGATTVTVVRQPRVVVLTTGDELVELHQTPLPHQIRDSNRASVGDLVRRAGGIVRRGAIVADTREATRAAIADGLLDADVLVLSGGVSMGQYDYVAEALVAEGVEQHFHRVHMKPGKPLWYGRKGSVHVFGLPGNPVSAQVTARLFLVPVIRGLAGRRSRLDPVLELPLTNEFRGTGGRPTFQPAAIEWDAPGGPAVRLLRTHGSGDLRHFAEGTTIAFLPERSGPLSAGHRVPVLLDAEAVSGG